MKSNSIWIAISCLAIGFIVGREWSRSSGGDSEKPKSSATATAGGGQKEGPIPADWLKESDFGATEQFAGMTPAQRYTALKVVNEKPCDCGCPHGSVAKCKKDDPGCPRAPTIISQAAALAKQGKSVEEILAAVKKPGGDAPAQAAAKPPEGQPQKVELAAWTPTKGPKDAKVTIIEFSDFQ